MTEVISTGKEDFESMLKRFNRRVLQDGIMSEIRRHEYFEKPSVKRKRKEAAKRRKSSRAPRRRSLA